MLQVGGVLLLPAVHPFQLGANAANSCSLGPSARLPATFITPLKVVISVPCGMHVQGGMTDVRTS